MKIEKIKHITGKLHVLSGLHIGAGRDVIEIGGLDQPVIKHPITGAPYVPGSSLKGKMRSLLELYYFIDNPTTKKDYLLKGNPCGCGKRECLACVIFGYPSSNVPGNNSSSDSGKLPTGSTRLIVRDAMLCSRDYERFLKGELPMEIKYENTIDRVTGVAQNPRPLERVPAGVDFDFSMSFKVFEGDDPNWINCVYQGLKLVELDALGGGGSRGSGQVRFDDLFCDDSKVDLTTVKLR